MTTEGGGGSRPAADTNTERAGIHSHDLNSTPILSTLPAMASLSFLGLGLAGARPESMLSPEQAFFSAEQASLATELVRELYRVLRVPPGAAAPSPGWAGTRLREGDGEIPPCLACGKPETLGKTVICDSCERSFHTACVRMKPRQAAELDEWVCPGCEAGGVRPRFPLGKRLLPPGLEIGRAQFGHNSCSKAGDEGNAEDDTRAKKGGFGGSETGGNGDGGSAFSASPGMSRKEQPRRPSAAAMAYRDGDRDGDRDRDGNREGDRNSALPSSIALPLEESNADPLNQGKGAFVRSLAMPMVDGDRDSTLATLSFLPKEGNVEPLNQGKGASASFPLVTHTELPRKPPTVAAADGEGDLTPPAIAFPPKEGSASESLYQGTNLKERLRRPKRERDAEEDEPRTVKRVHAEASVSGGSEDIKLRSSSRLKALYSGKDDDIAKEVETCTADQMLSESGNDETAINSSSRRSKGKGVLRKDFHEAKLQFSDEEAEYIQKLRDFIEQLGGFLEDGWYLKIRRRPNGEKEIFYYSHDGQKFRSRKEVARFLGVLDWKKEDLEQRDNATSLLNSRRFIGVQKRVQESEDESDSDEDELQERQKFEVETSDSEDEHFEPDIEVDLPLECMDLRIESLGTIVQHSESHEKNLIWPVGYCSSWHDSITASVFTSEVLDRGSAGPVFRVTRKPCSDFTNLGYMEGSENEERDNSLVMASRLKFDAIYDEDYELGVLLGNLTGPLVAEDCVTDFLNLLFYCEENPCENIRECNLINGEAEGGSKAIKTMKKDADSETDSDFLRQLFAKAEDSECKNFIGEVSVEGPTPIEAWAAMGKKFFAHLQEFSIGSRHLKFGCSHSEMPPLSPGLNLSDILETLGMETLVANEGDNNPLLITLRDWVGQDRFGFDIPVVQKLIARKPKVKVIRPPPPLGDLIGSKILDEGLVGDLLQIWEFLCRFSEILGLKEVPSLQDLEEALCMGMGNSVISPSGGEQMGSDCREEKAKIQNVVRKKSADLLSVSSSSPVGLDSVVLSSIHISLLRILLPELEQKLLGMSDLTLEAKQGKKKDVEPVTSSSKGLTEGLIILNEVTWPEVARRFIVAMLSLNNGVENADLSFQERWKVLKCIQGDGGALCGGLDGSAGIEADAQLLAEAQKRVFHQDSAKGENVPTLENEEEDEVPEVSGKPEWMSLLEPVRKLATNVGARIRNCIRDALEKDPPEWAKEMLEWSISKDVYKGNASGPTKRAVLSVLEKAAGLEKPPSPKKPKVKKVQQALTISPEFIMRRCRAIIRELIASDGVRVFCNMLGGTVLGYYVSEQDGAEVAPTMVSCPLDFRIIDAKLASGAYGVSHESFAADMQQLWNNLNTVFQDKPEMIKVGESLSHQFESLYKEKVLDLVNYIQEQAAKSLEEEDATEENAPVVPEIKEEELLKAHWEWGVCKICGIDKDDDKVLLCDECDAEYHIYCLVPPLSKIPQGNWYCPTCIAGGKGVPSNENIICRRVSRLSRAVSTDEGRALQSLAGAIVEKDYWDLGVSDKIRLLKFLCDKALDSNAITENLDQYMDASLELQQKLYSLYEERKNAALEANTQQIQRIDLGKKPLQSMDGQMNSISNGEEALYKPDAKVLRSRDIDLNCIAGTSDQGLITTEELISGGEKKKSNIGDSGINPGERISLPISEGDQVKEANAVEGVPSQTASELIEMQIDELEMEAMRMAMRREWLGRDLLNRHYWVLGWEGKLPWLVVDESGGFINEWASKLSNGSMVAKPNNTLCESDKKQWMSYESDAGLEQLLEWLRPTSRREQALKESILRWRMSLLKGNGRLSANKEIVQRPLGRPRLITIVPATKAALFLVKRFGPIYWPDGDDGMLGGGRKRVRTKAIGQSEECLFRCECLEIVWPSRCHCQGCHQTFDSIDELHSHGGGDCFSAAAAAAAVVTSDLANTPTPKTNKKKGGDGRSKKPKNALEGTIKLKISKKQAKKFAFMAPDFEEILKVFKLPVSNQDRVRQIGFIAEDTPAFAPTLSFSPIFDPFLTISGKIKARGDHKGARLVEITNLGSIPNVAEDGKRQKQACLKPKDIVVTPCKSAQPETPDTKGETASPNPQSSNGEEGGSTSNCTTPFGSLQPLSGRSLWVLRRLKANLLDMEALLSLDALEPSRTDPDKRRMWRSFVKSAASIFEVLQAEICLERTLKADYLKETWCNWQSLSSTVQSATLSSLALRIFSLDAAIMYKKAMVGFDPNFPGKKSSSGPKKKALEK